MGRPKSVMTKEVEKYIDENWSKFLHRDMAEHLNIGKTLVSNYCIKKCYKKLKKKLDGNRD